MKDNKEVILRLKDIPEEMYGIHLWNEVWRCNNFDKDKKYGECLYEELKEKHRV